MIRTFILKQTLALNKTISEQYVTYFNHTDTTVTHQKKLAITITLSYFWINVKLYGSTLLFRLGFLTKHVLAFQSCINFRSVFQIRHLNKYSNWLDAIIYFFTASECPAMLTTTPVPPRKYPIVIVSICKNHRG